MYAQDGGSSLILVLTILCSGNMSSINLMKNQDLLKN